MMQNKKPIIKYLLSLTLAFFVATPMSASMERDKKTENLKPAKVTPLKWEIQHWKTKSNVPVFFVKLNALPIVNVQVIFKAGSAYDGKQYGIASLTNALLNKGSKTLEMEQMAEKLDLAGAQFAFGAGRDRADLSLRSLSEKKRLQPALSVFKEIISNPGFPEDAFKREKKQTVQALKFQKQNPGKVSFENMFKALYKDHPYAHPTLGTLETVEAITLQGVKDFYSKHYNQSNMTIALVGNLSAKQAKKISEELASSLIKGEPVQPIPPVSKNKSLKKHINFPSDQTHLVMGQIAISAKNPDRLPLAVANEILGVGFTSWLFKNIREKEGLAYSVGSRFLPLERKGPFLVSLQTEGNQTKKATSLTQKTLDRFLREGPSEAEIERAKNHLILNFSQSITTNSAIMANVASIGFYGLPIDYLSTYQSKIKAITKEDVQKAIQSTLSKKDFVTITVGNGTKR